MTAPKCPACRGVGEYPIPGGRKEECDTCDGTGAVSTVDSARKWVLHASLWGGGLAEVKDALSHFEKLVRQEEKP